LYVNPQTAATLKKTELFRDLDDDVIAVLAPHAVEKDLARGELLFIAGEEASGLFVIAKGSVRAFRSGLDGREQVIHVERAVATIAEVPVFDDGNYPSSVAAEEPTRVLFIRKADIRAVCLTHPQLALAAAKLLAARLRKCAELVESLSLREVGQRVAKLLFEESRRRGTKGREGTTFELQLTHNQLAARIGTVREVVTRAMTRLQEQGLIRLEGKTVTVPDDAALQAYVEN
jgi:CRP/FNR family transcriptional regulator